MYMYNTVSSNIFAQTFLNQLSFYCFRYVMCFQSLWSFLAQNRIQYFQCKTAFFVHFFNQLFLFSFLFFYGYVDVLKQVKVSRVVQVCLFVAVSCFHNFTVHWLLWLFDGTCATNTETVCKIPYFLKQFTFLCFMVNFVAIQLMYKQLASLFWT